MVNEKTNSINDSHIITSFFKNELEIFVKNISKKKKWDIIDLSKIVNKNYEIFLKKGEQVSNKRKLILLPSNKRCVAVLDKNGKKIQCTRKRPKTGELCGLHSCKSLKHGCIHDYNKQELYINEENHESQIYKFDLEINMNNNIKTHNCNEIIKNKEDDTENLFNLDYIVDNYENFLTHDWKKLLINNVEYFYDSKNIVYQNDDDTLEEIGTYDRVNNLIESY